MTSKITCRVASLDPALPPLPLQLGSSTFADIFATGSNGDIDLNVVAASPPAGSPFHGPVEITDLNAALDDVTKNPTNVTSVDTIAVLLADSFAPKPGVFGFMFDRGFTFEKSIFGRVPREGCAVFVGQIQRKRPATFTQEAAFTAVHELGHVFNLFHIENGKNLMASSPNLASPASLQFNNRHKKLLALCSAHREIHPGGSEFGDLGTLDSGPDSSFRAVTTRKAQPLRLTIAMQRAEFWHFEPVELDLTVSVEGRVHPVHVPDALDPGYETFRIWIEEPSGERRLYRSSKHFCAPPGTIRIAPGAGFRRDISIFGQSGGYTFRRSGPHTIQAEMLVPGLGVVRSNELNVNVLSTTARHRIVNRGVPILSREDVARMLFYRSGNPRSRAFRDLEELVRSIGATPTGAVIHYALGRVLLRNVPKRNPAAVLRNARGHLQHAADHRYIGSHQRDIAERLGEQIAAS